MSISQMSKSAQTAGFDFDVVTDTPAKPAPAQLGAARPDLRPAAPAAGTEAEPKRVVQPAERVA